MKTNKTINLVRGIMMLTRSSINREEKTLINKIEDACYELIDMAHKSEIRVVDRLTYIDDLFVLATQVNLFSQENCEVVRAAIKNILNYYETKPKDNTDHSVNLGVRDLLAYESLFSETNENKSSANLRELSEQNDIKKISLRDSTQAVQNIKDNKNIPSVKSFEKIKDKTSDSLPRKLSRKEEVMRALSHTPVGIRDIADKVLGCSEKTLQRELNTLVDSGLVNRIGEKRWSKYVLA